MINLIIFCLAVFAVSHIVAYESGPFDAFGRLRKRHSFLECAICVSVWVSIILFTIVATGFGLLLTPLAAIAAVILLERL